MRILWTVAVAVFALALCMNLCHAHKAPSGMEYPAGECCNGQDCEPIAESQVTYDPKDDSYTVKGIPGERFVNPDRPESANLRGNAVRKWRWSTDGEFHRCASTNPAHHSTHTYCLLVPKGMY